MNPEDVGKILDEIGQRVGPAGEHVYQVTVQRIIAEGVLSIGFGTLLVVVLASLTTGVLLHIRSRRRRAWDRYEASKSTGYYSFEPDSIDYTMSSLMVSGLALFGMVFALSLIHGGALKLLTPEYSAIYRFIEALP